MKRQQFFLACITSAALSAMALQCFALDELPKGFPLPLYPDLGLLKVIDSKPQSTVISCIADDAKFADVFQFYKNWFKKNAWTIEHDVSSTTDGSMIAYSNDHRAEVICNSGRTSVTIKITVAPNKVAMAPGMSIPAYPDAQVAPMLYRMGLFVESQYLTGKYVFASKDTAAKVDSFYVDWLKAHDWVVSDHSQPGFSATRGQKKIVFESQQEPEGDKRTIVSIMLLDRPADLNPLIATSESEFPFPLYPLARLDADSAKEFVSRQDDDDRLPRSTKTLAFSTLDPPWNVAEFYRNLLAKKGWVVYEFTHHNPISASAEMKMVNRNSVFRLSSNSMSGVPIPLPLYQELSVLRETHTVLQIYPIEPRSDLSTRLPLEAIGYAEGGKADVQTPARSTREQVLNQIAKIEGLPIPTPPDLPYELMPGAICFTFKSMPAPRQGEYVNLMVMSPMNCFDAAQYFRDSLLKAGWTFEHEMNWKGSSELTVVKQPQLLIVPGQEGEQANRVQEHRSTVSVRMTFDDHTPQQPCFMRIDSVVRK